VENLYSLMQVLGEDTKLRAMEQQCTRPGILATEVAPRTHTNCTNEIPAELNSTKVFMDLISFVIKAAAAPVMCNDMAPP
jgi:hypothetical protein